MPIILITMVRWLFKLRGALMLLFLKHQILCSLAVVLYFCIKINSQGTYQSHDLIRAPG